MRLAPPKSLKPGEEEAPRRKNSFTHFFRVLRHTWPHRRLLWPALVCIFIVSISYSASIAALLPVLQAILRPNEGVPAWVHRTICAKRLNADLDTFVNGPTTSDSETSEIKKALAPYDYSMLITAINDRSPIDSSLRDLTPLLVTAIDDTPASALEVFAKIAKADKPFKITYVTKAEVIAAHRTGDAAPTRTVEVAPKKVSAPWRAAIYAVKFLPPGNTDDEKLWTLGYIMGAMFLIQLIGGAARFGGEYMIAVVAGRTLIDVRRMMYRKVLRLPVLRFAQHGSGDLMSRFIQDSQDIYRGLTYIFVQSIREPLKAIGVFVVALVVNWQITLIAVFGAPVAALIIRAFGKSIRKRSRRLLIGYGRMLAALEGSLSGIRIVKGYGAESYERRHLYSTDFHMFRQQAGIERIDAFASPLFEVMGYLLGAILTIFFASQVMANRLEAEDFMVMVICLGAMFDPIRKLSNFYNRIERANAAAERVFEVLDMPDELQNDRARRLPQLADTIEFRDIVFQYPTAERPAVNGFSLTVKRGESIAIVGPNGCGKTTLLSLLIRFFDPQSGEIIFDGVPVREASLHSLRRQIGLVTQDSVMFADTVANNIAYGDPAFLSQIKLRENHRSRTYPPINSRDRIVRAAKAAFAHEFIEQLPQGYDTQVGEHGSSLSGGQKQRLSIARAILADPPILIFDEATSQIDAESEQKIHEALVRFLKNRTAFIIAHRFSTIMQADRIVVMDNGKIVDVGRHAELVERCRLYKSLFESQQLAAEQNSTKA